MFKNKSFVSIYVASLEEIIDFRESHTTKREKKPCKACEVGESVQRHVAK